MKMLVIGGAEGNIGYYIAKLLGEDCFMASRHSNPCADISNPEKVGELVSKLLPETIIVTAGCYPDPQKLGYIHDWAKIADLVSAKILGVLVVLNVAVKFGVKRIILVGGSALSGDSRFCHFTIVNGAMWSAVQFATKHTKLEVFYLELGVVIPSPMGNAYLSGLNEVMKKQIRAMAVSPQDVVNAVAEILAGKHQSGDRVKVNKDEI